MKKLALFLCLFAVAAGAQELLRIVNGAEERASIPQGLPDAVTNAYAAQLAAAGYKPVETVGSPRSDWCTRSVRTLTETNGVWIESWIECSVPIPLDPVKLCNAVLARENGTNALAAAMSVPAVAEWFVGNPVYTRGSELAGAMQQLLGISTVSNLEELIRPCAVGGVR
jgi:hypothetical protein